MNILGRGVIPCLSALGLALLSQGCSSPMVLVAPTPPVKYEKLGHVEATACGAIFGPFIPIALNGRVTEARDAALAKAPGATSLINVEMREDWAWALILISRCTTISGDAIKEVR